MPTEQDAQPSPGHGPATAQSLTMEQKCRFALQCVSQPPQRAENLTTSEQAACAVIHDKCLVAGECRLDDAMGTFLAAHVERLRLDQHKAVDADAEPASEVFPIL